jgi:hypothetical protein
LASGGAAPAMVMGTQNENEEENTLFFFTVLTGGALQMTNKTREAA